MTAYVLDGRAIDVILALVAIEGGALVTWRARTGRGPSGAAVIVNLLAGACLLLALRVALTGGSPEALSGWLAAALAAHGVDLFARFRDASESSNARREVDAARNALNAESFHA